MFTGSWASSKKRAEQNAALLALEELGLIRETRDGQVIYVPEAMESAGEDG
jgi:hypothetical protein